MSRKHFPFIPFAKITGWPSAVVFLKPRVLYEHGKRTKEKLPKKSAIITSNHISLLDFLGILTVFPFRRIRFLMAEVLFTKAGILTWFLKQMGGIRIDRYSGDSEYMYEVIEALRDGSCLGICPESRLNRERKLLPFKKGAAYIALKTNAPVIPVCHDGNYGILKRFSCIIGDPVYLSEMFEGGATEENVTAATEYLQKRTEELKHELEERVRAVKTLRKRRNFKWYVDELLTYYIQFSMYTKLMPCYRPKLRFTDRSMQGRKMKEASLIAANHRGFMDPPTLCSVFSLRHTRSVASYQIFEKKVLGWLMRHCRTIEVTPGKIDMSFIKEVKLTLLSGDSVVIFPEGHIHRDGELGELENGTAYLSVLTGKPIIPVCIQREYNTFGHRQEIWVGTPIYTEKGNRSREYLQEVTDQLYAQLKNMRSQYLREEENRKIR